ncbi:hypothetical protein TNCV_4652971 [Trichonephila clavipes]|nr:hypothetical protein TNCV_4652971 [Trichonephila clavipes]
MNLPLFRLPISIEALDALIKKVEEQHKRHTAKKIDKKNPSLPPTTSQTSNPAQAPPPPAESSDSEIEDEDTGKSNPTAVGNP